MELIFSKEQIAIVRKAMEEVAKYYEREYGTNILETPMISISLDDIKEQ